MTRLVALSVPIVLAFSPALVLAQATGARPAAAAASAPYRVGAIELERPWLQAPPAGMSAVAAYVTIVNRGAQADTLTAASSVVAHAVRLIGPATIAAGGTAQLAPGGERLMLLGPTRNFAAGEKVPVTLSFARAGQVTAEFDVLAAPPPASAAPAAR